MNSFSNFLDMTSEILDIEELANQGKEHEICPYFLMRQASIQNEADLIFVPYNYLIDPDVRELTFQNLDLSNCIILFDEAHNLESVCTDAASFDLTPTDLALSMYVFLYLNKKKQKKKKKKFNFNFNFHTFFFFFFFFFKIFFLKKKNFFLKF
eukprot:GSMAST32.ASY1.ANO1.2165.1 assembled CDS